MRNHEEHDANALRILREDDPEHTRLLEAGWRVVSTSWGARLELEAGADTTVLERAVARARGAGYVVRLLGVEDLPAITVLDAMVGPDFPDTPASRHEPLPEGLDRGLAAGAWLAVGAEHDGGLVAFTLAYPESDRYEVERTAVAPAHRGRGLAQAVKAVSILTTRAAGVRRWGTGGAGVNAASLAMNRALGFVLEPLWHTLAPPTPCVGYHHESTVIVPVPRG